MARLALSRRGAAVLVVLGLVLFGAGTVFVVNRLAGPATDGSGSAASGGGSVDPRDPRLSLTQDAERKTHPAEITSPFENATVERQYDYAENIGDGLGITAGRAGFTSNTGVLLLLVDPQIRGRYPDSRSIVRGAQFCCAHLALMRRWISSS